MEAEIAIIKAKFDLRVEIFKKFGKSIKTLSYLSGDRKVIHFDLNNVENKKSTIFIHDIIEKYPPSETRYNVYSGKDGIWTETPYKLYFSNGVNNCKVQISYINWMKNYMR